jgi:hypothetical protein
MKNERMYIAFYKSYSGTNWNKFKQLVTKVWTFGKYCHCEIVHLQEDGALIWYGATSYNLGGVAARPLQFHVHKWDIFEITEHINFKITLAILRSKLGLKYDWLGIFLSQAIPFHAHNDEEYFCSEYLAQAVRMDNPYNYSPNSLKRRMQKTAFISKKPLKNLDWNTNE